MGDRCTIGGLRGELNVYLHWNGEPDYVTALLDYCAIKGYRPHGVDVSYATARLAMVACNAIDPDGGLSVGVTSYEEDWDNGHYIVDDWKVVARGGTHRYSEDPEVNEAQVWEYLTIINSRQPDSIRMDEGALREAWDAVVERRCQRCRGYTTEPSTEPTTSP